MRGATKLVVVALAVAVGCAEAPAQKPASDAVRNYFAAVTAKDCSALGTLSGGKVAKNLERLGCDKLIEGYEEMGLKLIVINNEVEDGRDRNARIVSAMVNFEGKGAREVMLRVERSQGHWVLVSI